VYEETKSASEISEGLVVLNVDSCMLERVFTEWPKRNSVAVSIVNPKKSFWRSTVDPSVGIAFMSSSKCASMKGRWLVILCLAKLGRNTARE